MAELLNIGFEAAHRLPQLPPSHKCFRLHGHSYVARIACESGGDLAAIRAIVEQLDHRYLNEVDGLENATAENICAWLWRRAAPHADLLEIRIEETCESACLLRAAPDRDAG